MTPAMVAGAVCGLGVIALIFALFPGRPALRGKLAAFDAIRYADSHASTFGESDGRVRRELGGWLAEFYATRGWRVPRTRADLSLLGRSFEGFLATKVLLGACGLIVIPLLFGWGAAFGIGLPFAAPVWLGLIFAAIFFLMPDAQLRRQADARRRDFRHVVSAFLDLVSMNLAGGRGVPEALMTAASVGDGWAMWRIRDALSNARITGHTPWDALGSLGEEVGVDELRDLSSALSLVADDGAKIRQSLGARAASMRSKEISELEGSAGERSQSMLIAQLLLCAAFLLFLTYPALMRVMSAT